MRPSSTLYLKIVILLLALTALFGMVWFPPKEGMAANLSPMGIYTDPFIIFVYIGSTPFFIGLFQAFKLLNLIDANRAFSQAAVNTLRAMKIASLFLIGFIVLAILLIRLNTQSGDPAGPTALGILAAFAVGVIGTAAAVFEKLFQNAVDIKAENELTV